MIKAENYGKITENSRNLPENFVAALCAAMGGGSGFAGHGGGLPIFSMTGGFLADSPIGHVCIYPNPMKSQTRGLQPIEILSIGLTPIIT